MKTIRVSFNTLADALQFIKMSAYDYEGSEDLNSLIFRQIGYNYWVEYNLPKCINDTDIRIALQFHEGVQKVAIIY